MRTVLFVAALVALCLAVSPAKAQCGINRGVNVGVRNLGLNNFGFNNFGLRQVVVGNQLVTLDRFGNVVNRRFLSRNDLLFGRFNRNVAVNVGVGRRNLADRLLFGF